MIELPSGELLKTKGSNGEKAYRTIVSVGLAAVIALCTLIYNKIDDTSKLASSLQVMMTAMNGRADAQAERLTTMDGRIVRIENHIFFTGEHK